MITWFFKLLPQVHVTETIELGGKKGRSNLGVVLYLSVAPFTLLAKPAILAFTPITTLGLEPLPSYLAEFWTSCLHKFVQVPSSESLFLHCWRAFCSEKDMWRNSHHLTSNIPCGCLYPDSTHWTGLMKHIFQQLLDLQPCSGNLYTYVDQLTLCPHQDGTATGHFLCGIPLHSHSLLCSALSC